MNKKRFYFVNLAVLLVLLSVNLSIYVNRDSGYAYQEYADYNQLYQVSGAPHIISFANRDDSLEVTLSQKPSAPHWQIHSEGKMSECHSPYPVLKLKEGIHSYSISSAKEDVSPIELKISFTSGNTYLSQGRKRESVVELLSSNLPVGDYKTWPLAEWQRVSEYSEPQEKVLIKTWIREQAQLLSTDSSIRKVEKIALNLLKELDGRRGIPDDSMDHISPYQQFKRASLGQSKLWCGNFTSILAAFLEAEGLLSREVCLEGKAGTVFTSGHSLNEVFIPELRKWVMVDLTSKALLASVNGEYLNLLDLYTLHNLDNTGVMVKTLKNDSLLSSDYVNLKAFYDPYFNQSPRLVYYFKSQFQADTYSFLNKWKRYFFERPTYATFSGTVESSNKKFYCKQMAAATLLIFLFYLILVKLVALSFKKGATQNPDKFLN